MDMTFTPVEIGYAIVSLGLVAKGALDILARTKSKGPDRGCLYGDVAHGELEKKLDLIIELLQAHSKQSAETHDWALIIKTILEAKK